MKTKQKNTKSDSLWSWNDSKKRNNEKKSLLFPVSDFLHKAEDSLLGPGGGAGIGCGVGLGFGFVGGAGFGPSQWNQLKLVLGIGFGCGLGFGIGYGQGFGYGYSLQSLDSYLSESEPTSDSKKRGLNSYVM